MYLTSQHLEANTGLRHGFFQRKGGVSTGIFRELNCGGRGSAEPAAIVDENRRRVAQALGIAPERLLSTEQVHGPCVVTVEAAWDYASRPKADAMVTRMPGFGLGILTADCVPVLFADSRANVIGAAHAGWKGAFGGVLSATIDAMEQLGAERSNISVAIGPAIGAASYEVDAAFRARFIERSHRNETFFHALRADGHSYFNLPGFVEATLSQMELNNIDLIDHDTYSEEDAYFSFRRSVHRGESDYGRQISVITLT